MSLQKLREFSVHGMNVEMSAANHAATTVQEVSRMYARARKRPVLQYPESETWIQPANEALLEQSVVSWVQYCDSMMARR